MIRYSYYLHPQNGTRFNGEVEGGFRQVDTGGPWPYGDDPHLRTPRMVERHGFYLEHVGHGAESSMVHRLISDGAYIFAADKCYFGHFGAVSAVPESKEDRKREQKR
jgi:hypothetical protein